MRCLGVLAPYGWHSSHYYLQAISSELRNRTNGSHSAHLILHCMDLYQVELLAREGEWNALARLFVSAARKLEDAGAEAIFLAAFDLHLVADALAGAIKIPLLDVADAFVAEFGCKTCRGIGLLGASHTFNSGSFRWRLGRKGRYSIELPAGEDLARLDGIIAAKRTRGMTCSNARKELKEMIARFSSRKIRTIIVGGSELNELLAPEDYLDNIFNLSEIHAMFAVDWMLSSAPCAAPARDRCCRRASRQFLR